jgi:hypothetical protein
VLVLLSHPNVRIIGQNYNYDTQWIERDWGCRPNLTIFLIESVAITLECPGQMLGPLQQTFADVLRGS